MRITLHDSLTALFAEVLGLNRVDSHDSFFELGGDSIRATLLLRNVESRFGVRIRLEDLFDRPSVEELAELMGEFLAESGARPGPTVTTSGLDRPDLSANQRAALDKAVRLAERGLPYAHNVSCLLHVSGTVDAAVLTAAVADVLVRHPLLRTAYRTTGNGQSAAALCAASPESLALQVVVPVAEGAEGLRALATAPFALAKPPHLRIGLHPGGPGRTALALTLPHICCDLRSLDILVADLGMAYAARLRAQPPRWLSAPARYGDFASFLAERAALDGPALAHWRSQLDARQPIPEYRLPGTVPPLTGARTAVQARVMLPGRSNDMLDRAVRNMGATPYLVCAAAVALAMLDDSSDGTVAFISPVDARPAGWEATVGWFSHTAVIRAPAAQDMSLVAFVHALRGVLSRAMEHSLHFTTIADALTPGWRDDKHERPHIYLDFFAARSAAVPFGDFTAQQDVDFFFPELRSGLAMWWSKNPEGRLSVFAQYDQESTSEEAVRAFLYQASLHIIRMATDPGTPAIRYPASTDGGSGHLTAEWG